METKSEPSSFLYFAYGSNMLTARLAGRCPSAKFVGLARAEGYDLVFTKRSIDKSGKATLAAGGSHCPGAIFEIHTKERPGLDKFEGEYYSRNDTFPVVKTDGSKIDTTTYIARSTEDGLKPYDWYLALIIAGCSEHSLDQVYIDRLRGVETMVDTDSNRRTYVAALKALRKFGVTEYHKLLAASAL